MRYVWRLGALIKHEKNTILASLFTPQGGENVKQQIFNLVATFLNEDFMKHFVSFS